MALVRDVKLTTTLFGPVSLLQSESTGVTKAVMKWLKPTITVESDIFGDHDIAIWGQARPIGKDILALAIVGGVIVFSRLKWKR